MNKKELEAIRCTPIEDLITEDFGVPGTAQRDEFESNCEAFIIGEQLKAEDRNEEKLHLPYRERTCRHPTVHLVQDIPRPRTKNQFYDFVGTNPDFPRFSPLLPLFPHRHRGI